MCGTAAAASSRSTVILTISEPARASAATCCAVASTSAVSVLVIDCTTMGAPPPTVTWPTFTATVRCLLAGPENSIMDAVPRVPHAFGVDALDIAFAGPVDEEGAAHRSWRRKSAAGLILMAAIGFGSDGGRVQVRPWGMQDHGSARSNDPDISLPARLRERPAAAHPGGFGPTRLVQGHAAEGLPSHQRRGGADRQALPAIHRRDDVRVPDTARHRCCRQGRRIQLGF